METPILTNPAGLSEVQPESAPVRRLLFIDNIRWLMIVFVVLIHLNCTYGNIGRWYYHESGVMDIFSWSVFGTFDAGTQAYFMGLLFFIAGYFVPGSYDKKGFGRFLRDRMIRLGIPTLIFMVILEPLTRLIMDACNHSLPSSLGLWYSKYIISFDFISGSGPLWFAFALLIFSGIYALLRLLFKPYNAMKVKESVLISHMRIMVLIGLISCFTFLVRLTQPIGTAFFNMQLCNFIQYIILFTLGIIAYRRNIIFNLPFQLSIRWFNLALWAGLPLLGVIVFLGGAYRDFTPFAGGFHWQAAIYAVWESFVGIGVCLGLLVLFRDGYNIQGKLSRFLAENAFAVYVFHTPIMVGLTMLGRGITFYPLLKMILMAIIILPLCFGFSYFIRKIPLFMKLFS